MKLKELILVESLFRLDSSGEIIRIIDLQPDCSLFVKSFMELDQSNLIQIFSFDGRVVTQLLEYIDESKHTSLYPLFYKMS